MICVRFVILFFFAFSWMHVTAQTDGSPRTISQLPENYIIEVATKISRVDKKLSRQTRKALQKFGRLEAEAKRKIAQKDSATAGYNTNKIDQLQSEFNGATAKTITALIGEYNAYTDTLRSTLKFLQQQPTLSGISKQTAEKLSQATEKLAVLEGKLLKAEEIEKYLRERNDFLKQQLQRFGMARELKQLEKTSYYYAAYVNEYKDMLKSRKKLEKKAMSLLYTVPAFKKFINDNSLLAGLFKIPVPGNDQLPTLAGLQTRASVQQVMQDRISAGGPNATQALRQQVQYAQAELKKLKDKISMYGSAEAEIPSFKPNDQKTKTFFQRLEYGMNIQFGRSNNLLPATSDIAITLGYKLNTNGTIGIGASYKIGLGSGWDHIKISNEGLGLRSYIDWKLGRKFYISGGYEQNYNSSFKNIPQLKNYSAWQTSGLLGISKKMQVRGKKNMKVQVLYDFLCYRHVPVTQPFVFRTGFSFK